MVLWFVVILLYLTFGYFYASLVEWKYKVDFFSVNDVVTLIAFWWLYSVSNRVMHGTWI